MKIALVERRFGDSPGHAATFRVIDLPFDDQRGELAEEIVGHVLPSELIHAGSLDAFRRKAA